MLKFTAEEKIPCGSSKFTVEAATKLKVIRVVTVAHVQLQVLHVGLLEMRSAPGGEAAAHCADHLEERGKERREEEEERERREKGERGRGGTCVSQLDLSKGGSHTATGLVIISVAQTVKIGDVFHTDHPCGISLHL